MSSFDFFLNRLCATAVILLSSSAAFAQSNDGAKNVLVTTSRNESTSLASPPDSVSFFLISAGVASENVLVAGTTNWSYSPGELDLALNAYPSVSAAAPNPASAKSVSGVKDKVPTVRTEIQVIAEPAEVDTTEGYVRKIDPKEIETSAGTFGDPSRYMQMLPGIVSDNDKFNDFVVRGGNPNETLFIVDNIEIPSINQLALSDTTGGFVSMIDNAAIQGMTLHTDAYDTKYDQRLSAVVEISTRKEGQSVAHTESEFGLAGVGASTTRPLGQNGAMFLSGRKSILNLLTNDIGMNGVPVYSNFLFRADKRVGEKNSFWGLSLTGIDSMNIHPSPTDTWETNPYDMAYQGWRNTTGLNWQHVFSRKSFGIASISNSEQNQSIRENAQLLSGATIYSENTSDGITTVKYDETLLAASWLTITAGARAAVDRLSYTIDQPLGLQNPYTTNPAPTDAMSVNRKLAPFSSAQYGQAAFLLPKGAKLIVGERVSQWTILGSTQWTPKALLMGPIFGRMAHVGYAEYAQLPPSLYILTFNNQNALKPIRSKQVTAGMNVLQLRRVHLSAEIYQKRYMDYPVAVNYPQLSLANVADTFGQAFLMFPMTSKGAGLARGIEFSLDYKPSSRLTLTTAVTYSRSWYSGLDGVLRRGNFDLPLVANVAGNLRLKGTMALSFRYSGASGKPYTPDVLSLSNSQNRDVYDLSRINASRAAAYSRLDFRLEQSHPIRHGVFAWHIGLDNALNTKNFYSYEWRPRAKGAGVLAQDQMPRFPDGGFKYSF